MLCQSFQENQSFPVIMDDLEVDINAVYKLETGNYSDAEMTWEQHFNDKLMTIGILFVHCQSNLMKSYLHCPDEVN